VRPPAVYLQPVPEPELRGGTNADLADYVVRLVKALRLANSDKVKIQEWAAEFGE
jgi:hypothetical protein